jgi:hypothetical protein
MVLESWWIYMTVFEEMFSTDQTIADERTNGSGVLLKI